MIMTTWGIPSYRLHKEASGLSHHQKWKILGQFFKDVYVYSSIFGEWMCIFKAKLRSQKIIWLVPTKMFDMYLFLEYTDYFSAEG